MPSSSSTTPLTFTFSPAGFASSAFTVESTNSAANIETGSVHFSTFMITISRIADPRVLPDTGRRANFRHGG